MAQILKSYISHVDLNKIISMKIIKLYDNINDMNDMNDINDINDMVILYTNIDYNKIIHILMENLYVNINAGMLFDPLDIDTLWRILKNKDFTIDNKKIIIEMPYFKLRQHFKFRTYDEEAIIFNIN